MPLPYFWKRIGIVILLTAVVLSVVYFWFDFRLTWTVFSLSSYFAEHKFFSMFPTNVADELIMLLYMIGFSLIVFSKEKMETPAILELKHRSLFKALFVNTALLIFAVLFTYGGSFVPILVLNLISIFLFYLIFFYYSVRRKST